jgi:hypothetical protein
MNAALLAALVGLLVGLGQIVRLRQQNKSLADALVIERQRNRPAVGSSAALREVRVSGHVPRYTLFMSIYNNSQLPITGANGTWDLTVSSEPSLNKTRQIRIDSVGAKPYELEPCILQSQALVHALHGGPYPAIRLHLYFKYETADHQIGQYDKKYRYDEHEQGMVQSDD